MGIPRSALPPRRRYAVLLAVLVASVILQSANSTGMFGGAPLDVAGTVLAAAIYLAVFHGTREQRVMAPVLGAILLIGWFREPLSSYHAVATAMAFQILLATYLWFAVASILRDLYRDRSPGIQNILGAICGYLIAGSAWASIHIIAYLTVPSAYNLDPAVRELAADWHGRTALFSYYSYTQLLTIGYADVTPLRAPATTLSLGAAIFGVFYTAVVVSQLVAVAQAGRKG